MQSRGRPLPERLALFVDLEARRLEVLHHAPADLTADIVGDMLAQDIA